MTGNDQAKAAVIEGSIKVTYNPWHAFVSLWKLIAVVVEYKLNKNETPYPDLVDAYRLAMKFFKLRK
jgi:hypothetical protein